MTRLTHDDIFDITEALAAHDRELQAATGKGLLGIACHGWNVDETVAAQALSQLETRVVPVTAGQGVITDFSATVAGILNFLGVPAHVADLPDVQGLTRTMASPAQALFMADDFQFAGIHLEHRRVADNTENTGRVYAAALDLMAGGITDKPALILGCGPVGEAAARELVRRKARIILHDIDMARAGDLGKRLKAPVTLEADLTTALDQAPYIIEATPAAGTLPPKLMTQAHRVAAPGVPQGADAPTRAAMGSRWLHDKLELGVAAMAVELITDRI